MIFTFNFRYSFLCQFLEIECLPNLFRLLELCCILSQTSMFFHSFINIFHNYETLTTMMQSFWCLLKIEIWHVHSPLNSDNPKYNYVPQMAFRSRLIGKKKKIVHNCQEDKLCHNERVVTSLGGKRLQNVQGTVCWEKVHFYLLSKHSYPLYYNGYAVIYVSLSHKNQTKSLHLFTVANIWLSMIVRLAFVQLFVAALTAWPQADWLVCIQVCESTLLVCSNHAGSAICCPSGLGLTQQGSSHTHTNPRVLVAVAQPDGIIPSDQRLMGSCYDLCFTVHQQEVLLHPPAFCFDVHYGLISAGK